MTVILPLDLRSLDEPSRINALNEAVTLHACPWPWREEQVVKGPNPGWCRHRTNRTKTRAGSHLWLGEPYDTWRGNGTEWAFQFEAASWATDANMVLRLLASYQWRAYSCGLSGNGPGYPDAMVYVMAGKQEHEAFGRSFPEAACIALLLANGVEVLT